jgi:glycosyltransferase involved in cell wall biosynthesis
VAPPLDSFQVLLDRRSLDPPQVSVIVPVFNQGLFLSETLDSIAAQDLASFEVIVCDDASSDNSAQVALTWAASNFGTRILIGHNRANLGLMPTLATALTLVRTEYVSVVAGDDVLEPSKLSDQVGILADEGENVGFVYSDALVMSENGELTGASWLEDVFHVRTSRREGHLFKEVLRGRLNFPTLTLLIRTDLVRTCGALGPGLSHEDWDLDLRISNAALGRFSSYKSARYRMRNSSLRTSLSPQALHRTALETYRPWIHEPRDTRRLARRKYMIHAAYLYQLGVFSRRDLVNSLHEALSTVSVILAVLGFTRFPLMKVSALWALSTRLLTRTFQRRRGEGRTVPGIHRTEIRARTESMMNG